MDAVRESEVGGLAQAEQEAAFAALSRLAKERAQALGVPGGAVGVIHDGWEAVSAFGSTSVETPAPVTPDTVFRIASMSKVLTATAALRLVHLGLVELDTPIRRFYPELRLASDDVAARVSLRHLLTHTGGWLDDPLMELDDPRARPDVLATLPQLTPLGQTWSYCTSGFFLVGLVIERITGLPFEQAIKHLLLDPLGMWRTGSSTEQAITHRVAVGHQGAADGHATVVRPWPPRRWDEAAQGLYSTPNDLLRFARFHLGDGRSPDGAVLLSATELALMRAPLVDDGSRGLGWVLRQLPGARLAEHPGGLFGYASDLLLVAERGFGIVVISNFAGHALDRELIATALRGFLGLAEAPVVPRLLEPDELRPYVGRYVSPSRELHVEAGSDGYLHVRVTRPAHADADGVLRRAETPPMRAGIYGQDQVVIVDGSARGDARGQFLRDPDGSIVLFRFPTFVHVRQPSRISLP